MTEAAVQQNDSHNIFMRTVTYIRTQSFIHFFVYNFIHAL